MREGMFMILLPSGWPHALHSLRSTCPVCKVVVKVPVDIR